MKQLVKVFCWGALISFLGSLPLGVLNATATQLAVENGFYTAFVFAAGAMIIELLYVYITLVAMDWISKKIKLFRLFEWFTTILILALSYNSLSAAINMQGISSIVPPESKSAFFSGMLLSALSPLHIVFWMGWNTVLIEKKILQTSKGNYNTYTIGTGFGTMAGFSIFICGGNYIIHQLLFNQTVINWIIGIALFITAIIQVYNIRRKPLVKLISAQSVQRDEYKRQ
jgi:threonine/homoserine/homoserine lactone efflux protein